MSIRPLSAVALAAAVAALIGCARKPPEPVPTKPPPVVVDYPVAQKVTDYEDFAGRTEAFKVVELKSRVTGYLKKIHFKDGQDIEEGKQLFDIDNRAYKAELDRAYAALNKAQKHLTTATADFNREKTATDNGVGSKQDYDKTLGLKGEAEADIDVARAAIDLAETNLHFCHITAPFNGRLSVRKVDEENLVKADETLLATIIRLDEVYATFDIDERTVLRLLKLVPLAAPPPAAKADLVKPLIDWLQGTAVGIALADDDDVFTLTGSIYSRENQIDAGTGTLRVRATIPNPKLTTAPWYMLSPGQFVRIRMPIGPARDAVLVPERAIGSDQGQRFLYVVNAENVVERRNVRVGQQYGPARVIEDGVVAPSDRIIVDGLLRVRPGVEVNPKPAAPAPKSPAKPAVALALAPPPRAKP